MEFSEEAYRLRIDSLFERHQSVQSAGFTGEAYKPGLEAMFELDRILGHPSQNLKFIHVAGTNGKGSVCTMLAASLSARGFNVGLYTSPHLLDFRERMALIANGSRSEISREEVWEFLESYESELKGRSFFEITTAMAFWWFDKIQADIVVLEVGLGGRLDSTNIVTPELSIVTSIGLDHCAILGGTRAEIAAEKAGIFKPGVPALVGTRDEETCAVFERKAAAVHCPLFFADDHEFPDAPSLDLEGPCQEENLRTVLAALDILGVEPDFDALSHAASIVGFRGRWERLQAAPEVICDIGHNPPALEPNFRKLEASGRPLIIIYGIMADKDLDNIAPLMPARAEYILVAPPTARALPSEALRNRLGELRPDLVARLSTAPDVQSGVRTALALAESLDDPLVYIGGSTFVVAEALPLF